MKALKEEFKKEVDCYDTCMNEATKKIKAEDYYDAGVFLDSAHRSLKEMGRIQQEMEDLKNGKVMMPTYILGFQNNRGGIE